MSQNNSDNTDNQHDSKGEGDEGNQNQQGGGNKSLLEYHMYPYEDGAGFQIISQHDAVTRFLEQQHGRCYQASNGVTIALGACYPEWKLSDNVIYLDPTGTYDLDKIDVTRFPTNGKVYRDGWMRQFKNALEEFIVVVREAYKDVLTIKPQRFQNRVVLV
jgi:hypothetical protein